MRAAIYRSFAGPIRIEDVPEPAFGPADVVVDVLAVGLCGSDLHGWAGTDPDIAIPHVGGHEFCGRVREVGADVRRVRRGDRVVAPFVCGCGECEPCRAGETQVCRRQEQPGFTRWGAFAERTTIPWADRNAVLVPDRVDDVSAALIGCRVSTAYRGVVERARLGRGEVLCVVGCGGVGLSAVAIGAARGASVVAVDRSPAALELATRLGADHILLAGADDPPAAVEAAVLTATGGAHVAVDAVGGAGATTLAVSSLRPQGRMLQIGLFPSPTADLPIGRVIRDELEVLGVHGQSASRLPLVLDLVADGLDLRPLVTRLITLEDVVDALPAMAGAPTPGITVATPLAEQPGRRPE